VEFAAGTTERRPARVGYRPEAMVGITVGAWSGLPIEAVLVWCAVTFTTVVIYEVVNG
jgi:hypothetical protein